MLASFEATYRRTCRARRSFFLGLCAHAQGQQDKNQKGSTSGHQTTLETNAAFFCALTKRMAAAAAAAAAGPPSSSSSSSASAVAHHTDGKVDTATPHVNAERLKNFIGRRVGTHPLSLSGRLLLCLFTGCGGVLRVFLLTL
jgi:hypothetical protein